MAEQSAASPNLETSSPPELIHLDPALPYRLASAAWPLPDVTRLNEAIFDNLDLDLITHLVLMSRSSDTSASATNPRRTPFRSGTFSARSPPKPCGKTENRLEVLNFIAVRRHEYVAFETQRGREQGSEEVTLNRPQPGHPIRCFWKPAREIITRQVQEYKRHPQGIDISTVGGLGNRGKDSIVRPP
ncbi:hypothetical protein ISF_05475 [Cordyceps fumosorosea ARSEF 2679]|uniref:Uncharacterized protein n=1 Tax=Cordyceps fumosorosea (strain ARSEF 2679) TaxID=1081104 RepID=A0A167UAW6_CORFA|nr:hypothetical protein ISF_05475 [Cordyceps fumosorosea ARSEF 2679]OAA61396.1 hypothetical protein ISF_05475 [Cordyceps fumosorosea ARSEF 2679]